MDKASSGRPHNGFILEASPLPQPLIAALSTFSIQKNYFEVDVKRQSREEELINKPQKRHYYKSAGWRHPLLLYVDGVLDEGNLGAIARSAYFLGVDAIATPMRSTAPWSQIALKASAGAAEAIPVFAVSDPSTFLGQSTRQGWRIYASDVIPSEQPGERPLASLSSPLSADPARDLSSRVVYTYARSTRRLPPGHSPVSIHPTILMMGAESTGLRGSLLNQANFKVGILHGRDQDEIGVDSLNVSAAASILCYEMLQKPKPARKQGDYLF
ncbi:Alpha/beta knot methyltransferase [Massariosphaeria phaeospora]|uniref:Alpha/beta knot methyltransferase n=1 Tax=Massariosphaeria phaeospora TaxID=100035 RepID=A0A7C8IDK3_9PLEO|nr:Alpha/beta knot methyltransferase [Massariosphaeria phaeospora]